MDHLHYYKFEQDCFCMIISSAILNMTYFTFYMLHPEFENDIDLTFSIGVTVIRVMFMFYFIRLCTHEHLISDYCNICWGKLIHFI